MKLKKVISGFSAVVMAVGAVASMSVVANADYSEEYGIRTWTFETPAKKMDLPDSDAAYSFYEYSDRILEISEDEYNTGSAGDTLYMFAFAATNSYIGAGEYIMSRSNVCHYTAPSDGKLVVTATTDAVKADSDYVTAENNGVYTTTVQCTEGEMYLLSSSADNQVITKITFIPDFVSTEAEASRIYNEIPDKDAAKAWTATVSALNVPEKLKWTVTNSDNKTADVAISNPAEGFSGEGAVRFGLILSGSENEINTINGVSLDSAE